MKKIIMATIIGLITCFYAQDVGKKPQAGYRIEVVVDTIQKIPFVNTEKTKIKIVSPNGRIVKSLPYDKAIISENGKYLLHFSDYKMKESYDEVERSLFNSKGELKWKKKWKTYPGDRRDPELLCPYWAEGISSDGNAIYVMYVDSSETIHLSVYDTTGGEMVNVVCPSELREIRISPDGKIIIARTGEGLEPRKGYTGDFLFILDVVSARKKILKAQGEKWSVDGFPLRNGKVELSLCEYPYSIILSFAEIPEDLSTLFQDRGEK